LRHCDLNERVEEAVETLGPLKNKHNVYIKSSGDPASAFCDMDLIKRVIDNLVGNAVKYTPKGGEVRITVESDKLQSRIAVSDTGAGIPKEYHAKIFDKFGQVKSRQEGKKYSTGLGLTFCKLAVEAHGGEIGVESESGKGSTFWFVLPSVPD
jgi:signal transduction histidine kinase